MSKVRVVRPTDEKKTIYGAGDEYAFLAVGAETDGRYFIMEALVPPGAGPPPHRQTRGRGAVHRFENESAAPARMLIFFAPRASR
jgi:hypothetical protein